MKDEKEGLMSKITEGGLSRRQFLTGEIPGVLPERSGPLPEEHETPLKR